MTASPAQGFQKCHQHPKQGNYHLSIVVTVVSIRVFTHQNTVQDVSEEIAYIRCRWILLREAAKCGPLLLLIHQCDNSLIVDLCEDFRSALGLIFLPENLA